MGPVHEYLYLCHVSSQATWLFNLLFQCYRPNEMFIHQLLRWEKDLFKQQITNRDDVWR